MDNAYLHLEAKLIDHSAILSIFKLSLQLKLQRKLHLLHGYVSTK